MTYQLSTGSLFLDYQLNLSSTPLTAADIASYLAGGLNDVNTFQNFAIRGFLPQGQGELFSKTTGSYYFGPLVHFTSAAEATFRAAEGDYSGAAISLAANEGGYLAGNLVAFRARSFLISLPIAESHAASLSVFAGFAAGAAATYGLGYLGLAAAKSVASWNPGVSPAPQMLRGADGRLYFVGNDAVFGGSGKLISGGVTPVYGIVDGLTSFRNFSPDLSGIPVIDRGPAPNGYDKPWGSASGPWGRDSSGVSFMNDGSAAPSSRGGAGNGGSFFGNDFGDVNLPGRGNVSYASSGASSGGLGSVASGVGNLLASANVSAGFIPGGVGFSVNWGNQSQNTNIPGFGQSGHNANWGGGSNDGVGFNSFSELGSGVRGFLNDTANLFSSVGNFFSSAASSVGKFFRNLFSPVALDLNGDGVQLTPATEGNKFYDMAGDGYRHLTAWTAPGDAILG